MSLEEVAAELRVSEPDRFGASLILPADLRPRLWTLYALNNEIARAPLQANEPLIAEMRLQWWADQLAKIGNGGQPAHMLLGPLAGVWGRDAAGLADMIEARRRDCYREPFATAAEVVGYVRETSVLLMRHALKAAGARAQGDVIEAQALGSGLAQWLAALPDLDQLGLGLARPDPAIIKDLAGEALAALDVARAERRGVSDKAAPVLYRGTGLRRALKSAVETGKPAAIHTSEFRRRFGLGRLALTGRWWD